MIEIGKTSETRMSYSEAVMYCFCLGEGWRLPTFNEYMSFGEGVNISFDQSDSLETIRQYYVTPVRDID